MATMLSTEQETNPWLAAEARFDEAADLLGNVRLVTAAETLQVQAEPRNP